VKGNLQLCCDTHPQDRCPACRSGTLGRPGCPKSARPSICTIPSQQHCLPKTRPKATAWPLPVSCCLCCCTPALACCPSGTAADPADAVAATAAQNASKPRYSED